MLTIEHLSKSFGDNNAVDDLSFSIESGQIVGFLGPNGAGKTTTMRLISGFLAPDTGSITILGKTVGVDSSDTRNSIGYLPENNPMYRDMLVSEILALSADLKGIPQNERKKAIDFVVNAVAIGDMYYRPIGELSKGYKQRVGMAVALLHQPPLLILDEPTEGLDPNQRADVRTLIRNLAKERTILLSTHVMQEASAICTRLIIINKGKLVADGTPSDLSHASHQHRSIAIEIEGKNVESALRSLPDVMDVDFTHVDKDRVLATITTDATIELRPEISRLAHKNKWILWHIAEEERKLEDVFHTLTSTSL